MIPPRALRGPTQAAILRNYIIAGMGRIPEMEECLKEERNKERDLATAIIMSNVTHQTPEGSHGQTQKKKKHFTRERERQQERARQRERVRDRQ